MIPTTPIEESNWTWNTRTLFVLGWGWDEVWMGMDSQQSPSLLSLTLFFLVFFWGGVTGQDGLWDSVRGANQRREEDCHMIRQRRGSVVGICCFLLKRRLVGKIKNSRIWQSEKGERKSDPDNRQKYASLIDWVTHTAAQRKLRWWERRCDNNKKSLRI